MELIGSLFLVLALVVVVALFVARPFFDRMSLRAALPAQIGEEEHRRSSLMAEHDRILTALQELEFDFTLGKVPEEDYPEQRMALLKKGAAVLRQLDDMQGIHSERDTAEERIAAAVAARRADSAGVNARRVEVSPVVETAAQPAGNGSARKGPARDLVEDKIAAKRRAREEKSAGFCPRCGRPVQQSDKFCARCGATL